MTKPRREAIIDLGGTSKKPSEEYRNKGKLDKAYVPPDAGEWGTMTVDEWKQGGDPSSHRVKAVVGRDLLVIEPRQEGVLHPPVQILDSIVEIRWEP